MSTDFVAGDVSNLASYTGGNDGIMKFRVGPAGAKVDGISIAADGTSTFLKTPVIANPNIVSMVRLHTANGYGSTNTKIGRYSTIITNTGSDITYADSATLGASFTINTSGVYSITGTSCHGSAGEAGLSLNTTAPTTGIGSIPITEVLCYINTGAYRPLFWTGYLVAGSVVRPHHDGLAFGAGLQHTLTVTKVS